VDTTPLLRAALTLTAVKTFVPIVDEARDVLTPSISPTLIRRTDSTQPASVCAFTLTLSHAPISVEWLF
jgi:hypothetical protein